MLSSATIRQAIACLVTNSREVKILKPRSKAVRIRLFAHHYPRHHDYHRHRGVLLTSDHYQIAKH